MKQLKSTRICLFIILVWGSLTVSVHLFSAVKYRMCAISFPEGFQSKVISADVFNNVVYLPISLNGNAENLFILDTGASDLSAVDGEVAIRRELGMYGNSRLAGAGSEQVKVRYLRDIELALPGMKISGGKFVTVPLHRMAPYWGKRASGLIGGNVLGQVVTEIDYDRSTVRFSSPEEFRYSGKGVVLPMVLFSGSPMIRVKVHVNGLDEPVTASMVLDTAARSSFFNTPFTVRNQLIKRSGKTAYGITGYGVGGLCWGITGRVRGVQIGDFLVEQPVVQFSTEKTGLFSSSKFDGIIGADLLSRFHVTFDYPEKKLILEPNNRFSCPFQYDMSGLCFKVKNFEPNTFEVAHVAEKSPAETAGIKKGDTLVFIDDIPGRKFTLETLKRYLSYPGRTAELVIKRGHQRKVFSLMLRPII